MLALDPHAATNRRAETRAIKPRIAGVRSRRPAIDRDPPLLAPFAALFSDLRGKRPLPARLLPHGDGAGSEVAQAWKTTLQPAIPARGRLSALPRQLLED